MTKLMFHLKTLHTGIVLLPLVLVHMKSLCDSHFTTFRMHIHLQTKYAGDSEQYFSWKLNLQKLKEKRRQSRDTEIMVVNEKKKHHVHFSMRKCVERIMKCNEHNVSQNTIFFFVVILSAHHHHSAFVQFNGLEHKCNYPVLCRLSNRQHLFKLAKMRIKWKFYSRSDTHLSVGSSTWSMTVFSAVNLKPFDRGHLVCWILFNYINDDIAHGALTPHQ